MKSQLAVQMFTVRESTQTAADFAETLQKISGIGYTAVQLSAVGAMNGESPAVDAALARRMLDDNGLKCIATHRSWDALAGQTEQEIEFHHTLGCDFTAIGGLPSTYREQGAEGIQAFIQAAKPIIARLKENGIRFGYHNHAWEFERIEMRAGKPYTFQDVLIDEGGPDLMMEVDVYWVQHAGANPQRIIERCAGRAPVIHVKDKEASSSKETFMAPVGEGNLDWEHLLPASAQAGVEWYAVEQDICRRDPFDCLRSSFEFLSRFDVRA